MTFRASSLCLQKTIGYSYVTLYLQKGFKSTLVVDGEAEELEEKEKYVFSSHFYGHG